MAFNRAVEPERIDYSGYEIAPRPRETLVEQLARGDRRMRRALDLARREFYGVLRRNSGASLRRVSANATPRELRGRRTIEFRADFDGAARRGWLEEVRRMPALSVLQGPAFQQAFFDIFHEEQERALAGRFDRARRSIELDIERYTRTALYGDTVSTNAVAEPPPHAALTIQMMADAMAEVERMVPGAQERLAAAAVREGRGYHRHDIYAELMAFGGPKTDPAADAKAETLLKAWLSPEQAEQYAKDGSFNVIGSDTGKRYTISNKAPSYNVTAEDGSAYCFGPREVPLADVMLAQKIAIETFENEALKVANRRDAGGVHPAIGWQEFYRGAIGRYDGMVLCDEVYD